MYRKIAILISMFFLCLGLNCRSPEAPEEPPLCEYRYNVKVIYTRGEVDYPGKIGDPIRLTYYLYDPTLSGTWSDYGFADMEEIGKDKFRCYLDKVLIHTDSLEEHYGYYEKHKVFVTDAQVHCWTGKNIEIQGAYDLEVRDSLVCGSTLRFKISKK